MIDYYGSLKEQAIEAPAGLLFHKSKRREDQILLRFALDPLTPWREKYLKERRSSRTMLIENVGGNYSFIRGGEAYAFGVRAHPGFAIVYAMRHPLVPLERGYQLIEKHLQSKSRPLAALCGIHLRIPQALSRDGFEQFNRPYLARLRAWGVEVEGANPIARTNVAPAADPVTEPMLAGFFYSTPLSTAAPTWLLAGVPEFTTRNGSIAIAAAGDTSAEGLRIKTQAVFEVVGQRLAELQASWDQATAVNIYTVHDLHPLLQSLIHPTIGSGAHVGLTMHHGRPPVIGLDLEIDAWSVCRQEIITRD